MSALQTRRYAMTEATRTSEYDDHQTVARLREPELRRLTREGTPTEKVWAAWSLALLLGSDASEPLTETMITEPTDGVRIRLGWPSGF